MVLGYHHFRKPPYVTLSCSSSVSVQQVDGLGDCCYLWWDLLTSTDCRRLRRSQVQRKRGKMEEVREQNQRHRCFAGKGQLCRLWGLNITLGSNASLFAGKRTWESLVWYRPSCNLGTEWGWRLTDLAASRLKQIGSQLLLREQSLSHIYIILPGPKTVASPSSFGQIESWGIRKLETLR